MSNIPGKKTLKIVILGDSGVGKTCLMNRYSVGKFTGQYKATIGADFVTKDCVIMDRNGINHYVTLQIWDTAGQERFQSLGVGFYRGADGALLTYDITDPTSLEHLNHWRNEFLEQVGTSNNINQMSGVQFPFVVIGNKIDKDKKDRKIPVHRAEEWCRQHAMTNTMSTYGGGGVMSHQIPPLPHYETSAKTSINVEEAFQEVARLALQYEEYKRRSQPQLFIPPPIQNGNTIDLRHNSSSDMNHSHQPDTCC